MTCWFLFLKIYPIASPSTRHWTMARDVTDVPQRLPWASLLRHVSSGPGTPAGVGGGTHRGRRGEPKARGSSGRLRDI